MARATLEESVDAHDSQAQSDWDGLFVYKVETGLK